MFLNNMRKKSSLFVPVLVCGMMSACESGSVNVVNQKFSMNDSMNVRTCEVAVDTIMQVGESPIWDYKFHRLLWIDTQGSLMVYTPADGKNRVFKLPKMIGTVVPYLEDKVIVGLADGIYEMTLSTGSLKFICDPEGREAGNRYNDGKCDAKGRLWIGTMDKDCTPLKASFFCVDTDGSGRKVLGDVTISNGVAWSPDGKTMYYQDTPTLKVSAFDFDEESGAIADRREVISLPDGFGTPDGNTIDEEGMLWVANWGAACVTRWNPYTGELLRKIDVPAYNVTALAFGGENLDELYITTASLYMPEGCVTKYPEAGKMFVVKPGVKGVRCNYWKGK